MDKLCISVDKFKIFFFNEKLFFYPTSYPQLFTQSTSYYLRLKIKKSTYLQRLLLPISFIYVYNLLRGVR